MPMQAFLPGRSYLVLGSIGLEADLEHVLPIDRVAIDGAEVGIKELRVALSTVTQRPYGEQRLLHIANAHNLNEASQNTLLKALEEPPSFLIIILQADSAEHFLPTVRSRLPQRNYQSVISETSTVLGGSEAQAAQSLQAIKERTSLVALLKQELSGQLLKINENFQNFRFNDSNYIVENIVSCLLGL